MLLYMRIETFKQIEIIEIIYDIPSTEEKIPKNQIKIRTSFNFVNNIIEWRGSKYICWMQAEILKGNKNKLFLFFPSIYFKKRNSSLVKNCWNIRYDLRHTNIYTIHIWKAKKITKHLKGRTCQICIKFSLSKKTPEKCFLILKVLKIELS